MKGEYITALSFHGINKQIVNVFPITLGVVLARLGFLAFALDGVLGCLLVGIVFACRYLATDRGPSAQGCSGRLGQQLFGLLALRPSWSLQSLLDVPQHRKQLCHTAL